MITESGAARDEMAASRPGRYRSIRESEEALVALAADLLELPGFFGSLPARSHLRDLEAQLLGDILAGELFATKGSSCLQYLLLSRVLCHQ